MFTAFWHFTEWRANQENSRQQVMRVIHPQFVLVWPCVHQKMTWLHVQLMWQLSPLPPSCQIRFWDNSVFVHSLDSYWATSAETLHTQSNSSGLDFKPATTCWKSGLFVTIVWHKRIRLYRTHPDGPVCKAVTAWTSERRRWIELR